MRTITTIAECLLQELKVPYGLIFGQVDRTHQRQRGVLLDPVLYLDDGDRTLLRVFLYEGHVTLSVCSWKGTDSYHETTDYAQPDLLERLQSGIDRALAQWGYTR